MHFINHRGGGMYGYEMTQIHNIFTDGFFMCSGIFLAKGIEKLRISLGTNNIDIFVRETQNRISRLWGPFAFSTVLYIIMEVYIFPDLVYDSIINVWANLLFVSGINGISGLGSTWYVSALFWCGLIISALLVYKPNISKTCFLPVIILLSYSFMNIYTCNNLEGTPIIWGCISTGHIRALGVLSMGVEIFYFSNYLGEHINKQILREKKILIAVIELLASLVLVYSALSKGLNTKSFLIYPSFGILCIIFLNHLEVVYNFTNGRIISFFIQKFVKYSYMIYLVHMIVLLVFREVVCISASYEPEVVYPLMMLCSIIFGIVCYWAERGIHVLFNMRIKQYFI